MPKSLSFILLGWLIPLSLLAQSWPIDQAREDLAFLKAGIQQYNPALELYNPEFEAKSEALFAGLAADSISHIEFFQYVSRLCALSNEGHFALGTWTDTVHSGFLANRYRYMPMSVCLLSGRLYVWNDYSNEQLLERGDEIVAINGTATPEVLAIFHEAYPADGAITTYTDQMIELGFNWMYYLYVGQPEAFELRILDATGVEKQVSVTALTREQHTVNYKKYVKPEHQGKAESDAFYKLTFEDRTAFLTLPSFDRGKIEAAGLKADKFYADLFEQLSESKMEHLVVDLRVNTGGRNEFADEMVPYLLHQPSHAPFLKKSTSWKGKERTYKMPRPAKNAFRGQIYALVDGRTYSNGSTLARYLMEFAGAEIIGEETGSRYEGYAAGSKQYVTLPNSGIRVGIPRYHILFPPSTLQTTTNRGLLPDFPITYRIADLLQGADLHMEKARSLIQEASE